MCAQVTHAWLVCWLVCGCNPLLQPPYSGRRGARDVEHGSAHHRRGYRRYPRLYVHVIIARASSGCAQPPIPTRIAQWRTGLGGCVGSCSARFVVEEPCSSDLPPVHAVRHPLSGSAVVKAPQSYPENAGPQSDWEVRRDDQQGDKSGPGHWKAERILSASLLALIPAAIFVPGTAVDMAIAIARPVHNHMCGPPPPFPLPPTAGTLR